MEKQTTVSPDLYSTEYFLKDNEGYNEYKNGLDNHIHPKYRKALKLADPAEGDMVLDIGCGRGELLYYCAKKGIKAFGIDYSDSAVNIAKETLSKLPEWAQHFAAVELGNVVTYDFKEKYNIIFMLEIVEHMHDWQLEEAFRKIEQIMAGNGRLIILTPNHYYERYLSPLKRIINIPWNTVKWPLRVLKGTYRPNKPSDMMRRIFKIKIDRGELNKKMHVNISTRAKLKKLLRHFDAEIRCEDHSKNIVSIIMKRWWGREIVAVARKK